MRTFVLPLVLSSALVVAACGQRHEAASDDGAKPDARLAKSLWRFAPEDAVFGIVVADGALPSLLEALAEVERIVAAVSGGKEALEQLRARLGRRGTFDPFDRRAYAAIGIDVTRGAAVFVNADEEPVVILSVTDRASFRDFVGGKVEKVGERELDRLPDGAYCIDAEGRYLCAERVATLDAAIRVRRSPLAERYLALPATRHGDLELLATVDRVPNAANQLGRLRSIVTDVRTASVAVTVSGGRLAITGWLEGTVADSIHKSLAPSVAPADGTGAATLALRLRVPQELFAAQLPSAIPVAGHDLRKAFFDQWDGDLQLRIGASESAPGFAGSLTLGLTDSGAMAELMGPLCALAAAHPALKMKPSDGACTGTLDVKRLGWEAFATFVPALPLTARVGKREVEVVLGAPAGSGLSARGPLSKALFAEPWSLAVWGRWGDPFASRRGLGPRLDQDVKESLTPEQHLMVQAARILFAHLYETGLGLRASANGIEVVFELSTMAADPANVYRAYSDLVLASIPTGKSYADELALLAQSHPGTLLAEQATAVHTGAPTLGLGLALGYSLSRSRLARFDKQSMAAEAPHNLERIGEAVRRYHADTGNLPPSTAMTPPVGECCQSGGKCVPRSGPWHGKGWTELLFELREPHYFSYQYQRRGKSFVIRAVGDLDCDGEASTYSAKGRLKGKRIEIEPVEHRGARD